MDGWSHSITQAFPPVGAFYPLWNPWEPLVTARHAGLYVLASHLWTVKQPRNKVILEKVYTTVKKEEQLFYLGETTQCNVCSSPL